MKDNKIRDICLVIIALCMIINIGITLNQKNYLRLLQNYRSLQSEYYKISDENEENNYGE